MVLALAMAVLAAAPPAGTRLTWQAGGSFDTPYGQAQLFEYVVEKRTVLGWVEVARVPHSLLGEAYDPAAGVFHWRDPLGVPGGEYRIWGQVRKAPEVKGIMVACVWRPFPGTLVPIVCLKSTCDCQRVQQALDDAAHVLVRYEVQTEAQVLAAVKMLVSISVAPDGSLAPDRRVFGLHRPDQHRIFLEERATAALHELVHACETTAGVPVDAGQRHERWARDERLEELDERFQLQHRSLQ